MPYFQTAIQTSLPVAEIERRLNAITRRKRSFMDALEHLGEPERAAFVGSLDAGSFRLQRIIGYRNSFLPVIRGRIEQGSPGSIVTLRMHLQPASAVFLAIWLAVAGTGALGSLGHGFASATFAFGILFGVLLVCGGFYPEAIAATRRIRRELGAG